MTIDVVTMKPVTMEEAKIIKKAFESEEPKAVLAQELDGFNNLVQDHDGYPLVVKCTVQEMQANEAHYQYVEV